MFRNQLPADIFMVEEKTNVDLNGLTYKWRLTVDLTVMVIGAYDYYRIYPLGLVKDDDDGKWYLEDRSGMFTLEYEEKLTFELIKSEHDHSLIQTVIQCAN